MPQQEKTKQIKPSTTQKVLKNSVYNFLTTIISRIGGLIFTIIVARILFPELFGIYSLALTIVLTIATFTDLGINATLIRYLAESLKNKDQKSKIEARSRAAFLLRFKILFTAIVSILLFIFSDVISIYVFNKPPLALPLKIGAIYLFTISLQGFFSSIFYALQKLKYTTIAEMILQILRIGLVVFFLYIYKSVNSIFIALTIAFFISFLFLYFAVLIKYPFLLRGKKTEIEKQDKRRLFSFLGWLTVSSISLIIFTHIDVLMLGIFLPSEFVGYYNVIVSLITSVAAFVIFGTMLLPVFTQLDQGKLSKGFLKVLKYLLMVSIPVAIGLAFIAVPAIRIIFGEAYVPQAYYLTIIITAAILSLLIIETALTAVYSAIFQAKEKAKIPAILTLISVIANIILNYIFIKIGISISLEYGLIAVALATLLVRYGSLSTMIAIAHKKFNLKAAPGLTLKPIIASIVMLAFLFIVDYFVTISLFIGIIVIIAAALIYILIMFILKGIMKADINMLRILK